MSLALLAMDSEWMPPQCCATLASMCGRVTLRTPLALLALQFGLREMPKLRPRYNIAPTQPLAVIREPGVLELLHWGLSRRGGGQQNNVRRETLSAQVTRSPARSPSRCMVLMDGFFEWRRDGRLKTPFLIELKDGRPFAVAGVLRHDRCAVITRPAIEPVAGIHNRMPLVLPAESFQDWLTRDTSPIDILDAAPPLFELTQVSTLVNSPANDDPRVVEPSSAGNLQLPF